MSDRVISYLNDAKCTDEHWNKIFGNKSSHTTTTIDNNICSRCKVKLEKGKALVNIYGGNNDFIGTPSVVTMSYTGQVKLIDVLKCPKCGFSIGM